MAEKPCNLLKNGGGTDKMKSRSSHTNSGSETRAQMMSAIYADVASAMSNSLDALLENGYILVTTTSGNLRKYFVSELNATAGTAIFHMFSDSTTQSYLQVLSFASNNGNAVYYVGFFTNSLTRTDASSGTDFSKIELYY